MNKQAVSGVTYRPIRRWACHKLECLSDFLKAYHNQPGSAGRGYLELYAGNGLIRCPRTDEFLEDASLRALAAGFQQYIFVTGDDESTASLKKLTADPDKTVAVMTGNANNAAFLRNIIDRIPRSAASFAFIDPPGYRALRWQTIERLVRHSPDWKGRKIDMLIIFPLEMPLLRNLTRPDCETSINSLYGNNQWQTVRQEKLEGKIGADKVRQALVKLFKAGLKGLGYRRVDDFSPASLSGQPLYHLIWASDTTRGKELLEEAWGKPRFLPCELLYNKDNTP